MVQTPAPPLTLQAFLALPETKPAQEFFAGQIYQKPMPQGQHSLLQASLVMSLNGPLQLPKIALALPELRCTFEGESMVPDVAVFTWDRIPKNADGTIANRFDAHPNWSIEILSPKQSITKVTQNLLHCVNNGSEMGWFLNPQEKSIWVYRPGQPTEIFSDAIAPLPVPTFAAAIQLTVQDVFGWLTL